MLLEDGTLLELDPHVFRCAACELSMERWDLFVAHMKQQHNTPQHEARGLVEQRTVAAFLRLGARMTPKDIRDLEFNGVLPRVPSPCKAMSTEYLDEVLYWRHCPHCRRDLRAHAANDDIKHVVLGRTCQDLLVDAFVEVNRRRGLKYSRVEARRVLAGKKYAPSSAHGQTTDCPRPTVREKE